MIQKISEKINDEKFEDEIEKILLENGEDFDMAFAGGHMSSVPFTCNKEKKEYIENECEYVFFGENNEFVYITKFDEIDCEIQTMKLKKYNRIMEA